MLRLGGCTQLPLWWGLLRCVRRGRETIEASWAYACGPIPNYLKDWPVVDLLLIYNIKYIMTFITFQKWPMTHFKMLKLQNVKMPKGSFFNISQNVKMSKCQKAFKVSPLKVTQATIVRRKTIRYEQRFKTKSPRYKTESPRFKTTSQRLKTIRYKHRWHETQQIPQILIRLWEP